MILLRMPACRNCGVILVGGISVEDYSCGFCNEIHPANTTIYFVCGKCSDFICEFNFHEKHLSEIHAKRTVDLNTPPS